MDKSILKDSKILAHSNLSFTLDNLQVTVHKFEADTYEGITSSDAHQHSSYELHYICEGRGHAAFSERTYDISPGDMFLLSPYTPHRHIVLAEGMVVYILRFDIQRLCQQTDNATANEESIQIIQLIESSANKLISNQVAVAALFEQGFLEVYYKKPGYYISVKQYIMDIILLAARTSYDVNCPPPFYSLPAQNADTSQMEQITEYIQNNMDAHLSNESIAHHVHISDRQLHRLIKKHMNMSPHQYVTLLRINYVKSLMHNGCYTMRSISELAGFSSEFHLSSAFKKIVHMTPREYLKNCSDDYQIGESLW